MIIESAFERLKDHAFQSKEQKYNQVLPSISHSNFSNQKLNL